MGQEKYLLPSSSATGKSAAIPLPRPVFLLMASLSLYDFFRKLQVAGGSPGRYVIEQNRFAVARRLRKPDVPGNYRREDFAGKMTAYLISHLAGQVYPGIKHGEQDTF